jgi:galactose mutarotase-like enzyme
MFQVTRGDTLELSDDQTRSSVSIVPARGAIATRFRVGDRELLYLDEATLKDPKKNVRGGIPVLFPSPGKLEGDRFERDGTHGTMKQHGFARDLPWEVAETRDRDAAQATLVLVANDATRAAFPWDFRLSITFSLAAARLRLDVRVENGSTRAMPFAFGIHPYFHVTDKARARVATKATRAFDNVKKEIVSLREGDQPFDLTAPELDLHLLDHGSTASELSLGDGSRIAIRGSPELTRWVVWTVEGKDYVCVEPWTAPANALNTGESLLRVEPGGSRSLSIEIQYVRATP